MPKMELKHAQKDLEQGRFYSIYTLVGSERMKAREFLKRLEHAFWGGELPLMGLEKLDGSQLRGSEVVDRVLSPSLGASSGWVEIREAHKIQDLDALDPLLKQAHTTPRSRSETPWVLVLISDALDGRKKSTKTLTQVSAYLPCDPVAEQDRGAWVKYLAKSLTPELSLKLRPEWVEALTYLDPWTLDRVSLELKKLDLVRDSDEDLASLISEGVLGGENEQFFLDAFLSKQKNLALRSLPSFCEEPEKVHPLMGLLGWNIRNLALILACREGRISTTELKLGPWILRRLESYAPRWTLRELSGVARHLSQMDFALKQTQTSGVTLWTDLVLTIS